jgi:Kef-type K+ transport system membrane component KefB
MADVLAWCALAVVLAMVRGQGPAGVLRTLALTTAVGVICVFVLRPGVRVLTTRYAGAAVPDAARLLAVGVLIIGLATLTDRIGVHAIFGGFLAGVVLPRGNPLLGSAVEQITKLNQALLVPVFFASIGMQANARAAISHPAVLAGGALLIVVAVAGKLGSAAPVAWAGGMPGRSALGLGVLMNARGVTEIVVLSIGLSVGIINTAAFTVLVVVALLTTCMAVPALRLLGLDHASQPPAGGGEPAGPLTAEPGGQVNG